MNYNLKKPCDQCPFRSNGEGVPLTKARIIEIGRGMLSNDFEFACHKTVDYAAEEEGSSPKKKQNHCAGALIWAEKHEWATQMMRITGRLGMYNPTKLEGFDEVWDDLGTWIEEGSVSRPSDE